MSSSPESRPVGTAIVYRNLPRTRRKHAALNAMPIMIGARLKVAKVGLPFPNSVEWLNLPCPKSNSSNPELADAPYPQAEVDL